MCFEIADIIVTVIFYRILPRILSKQMKLLHVAKSFDILGNGGLKFE